MGEALIWAGCILLAICIAYKVLHIEERIDKARQEREQSDRDGDSTP